MSEDRDAHDLPVGDTPVTPAPADDSRETPESLRREIDRLRAQLAKATAEAAEYRRSTYALLNELVPFVPPTDEEIHDLMHGPRGQPLIEIVEEYERRLRGE